YPHKQEMTKLVMKRFYETVFTKGKGGTFLLHFIVAYALLTVSLSSSAHQKNQLSVAGRVTDDSGDPISGVSISIKSGSQTESVTDDLGNFSIMVSPVDTLLFSHVGYQTQEIPVDNRTSIDVTMTPSESMMDEIAVVGYGTQRKI